VGQENGKGLTTGGPQCKKKKKKMSVISKNVLQYALNQLVYSSMGII